MVKRTSRKYSRKISKKYSRKTYKKKYSRKNYKKKNKRTKKRKSNKKKNIMKGGNFKTRLTENSNFDDKPEWYGEDNLKSFLKSNMSIDGVDNDVKLGCFKEIIIAGFTDCMRNGINGIIEFLNKFAEQKSLTHPDNWKWYVVAAGGDGFNRLLTDADKRPISPDIDVKVTYDIFGLGDNLSKYIRYLQVSTEVSAALDAAVVYINHNITREEPAPERPATLPEGIDYTLLNQFIILFKAWKGLCTDHNFLKPFKKLNDAEIGNFENTFGDYFKLFNMEDYPPRLIKRLSLMESGYNGKTLVFNNITLYALDLKFLNLPSFSGFAGILDVVITIPDQMGFLTGPPGNSDSDFKHEDDSREIYSISENYYLHDMEILLLFGLRIGNHKIIKEEV